MSATAIDEARLEQFMGQAVGDMSAAISVLMSRIGERTGLYRAMRGAGPLTSAQVADRAGCDERYVREWLGNQVAGGYVDYDAETDTYELPEEHALALADENSPFFLMGVGDFMASLYADEDRFVDAFRSGAGIGWHEHDHRLFCGTERFFRPGYLGHLVAEWIPALDGVQEKLEAGARVADVGCGHGASTIILAEAFPNSTFVGFDYHDASIETSRERAAKAGVTNASFEVASAQTFEGTYDLVCNFDCLHDMGDPVGAARNTLARLAAGGTYMIVEPQAGDALTENVNPVGRMFYAGSTLICTPASRAQEVGLCLGAQAGPKRLTEVLNEAGFTRVRKATETPFNIVLEAKA